MRLILPWLLICGLGLSGWPVAAEDNAQCYRKEDCECLFGGGGLKDGRWYAESAEGGFASSSTGRTVMHADISYIDIIDHCDGNMDMTWMDSEAGLIEWKLVRVTDGESMTADDQILAMGIDRKMLAEFYMTDPNLADLAQDNFVYLGSATYTDGNLTFPGTMLMAYSGLPGRASERGYATMTMRFDYGSMTFWATTGRVDFYYADVSDEVYQRRREVCRCDEVEAGLASDTISIRLQERMMKLMEGRDKRRIGYDPQYVLESETGKLPPVRNERFDPAKPWVKPSSTDQGNWPCLVREQLDPEQKLRDQGSTGTFGNQFRAAWDKYLHEDSEIDRRIAGLEPQPYVHPDEETGEKAKASVGGFVEPDSCREVVFGADGKKFYADDPEFATIYRRDPCDLNDIRYQSIRAHEAEHRKSCKARGQEMVSMQALLSKVASGKAEIPGVDAAQAEALYKSDLGGCMNYEAYTSNSYLGAKEELHAYRAGQKVLQDWVGRYCQR